MKYLILIGSLLLNVNVANAEGDGHGHENEPRKPKATPAQKSDEKPEEEQAHEENETHEEGGEEHADEEKQGEEKEEASASVGPGKAVLEAKNDGKKLKLSPEAQTKIGLKFSKISAQGGAFQIPKSALVEYQASTAVYRLGQDGFVEMIQVKVLRREADSVVITGALEANEQIAVSGVPLVRAAQLEASGQGGAHGH